MLKDILKALKISFKREALWQPVRTAAFLVN